MTLESYVSHSIINLEQACVLTELTYSKSYLCQRLLQAQQGRVPSFAMETVFVVFYLHS